MSECSDQQVQAAAAGSLIDLNDILVSVQPGVRRLVASRLRATANDPVVDDITQDVMVAISSGVRRLSAQSSAGLWAYIGAIVANKVADHIGRRVRRPQPRSMDSHLAGQTGLGALRDFLAVGSRGPGTRLAERDDVNDVASALESLSPDHRDVLVLAFVQRLPTASIGEKMGISRPAASMLVVRALRALRRALTGSSRLAS